MKIGYFLPNYKAYSEVWLQRQIKNLDDNISFIASKKTTESLWDEKIPVIDLTPSRSIPQRAFNRMLHIELPSKKLARRTINKFKPDKLIINYLTFTYELEEVVLAFRGDIYIQCHGYDVTWDRKSYEFPNKDDYDSTYLMYAKQIQNKVIFIANSLETKRRLLEAGVDDSRIRVLYLGYPVQPARYYHDVKKIKILYLGRFVDFKGPDLVLLAFERACQRGFQGELIMAGDGPLMTTCQLLQRRSSFSNQIRIIGAISHRKAKLLLRECHLFTAHNLKGYITNQVEAYGVSIIEAMAHGLPVVTGKSGGVLETIKEGVTGFMVQPGDVETHADKFITLGNNVNLRSKMGRAGRKRVSEFFSQEKESETLLNILKVKV